jgi:oligogalacturonide lyase
MSIGDLFPAESYSFTDPQTGTAVRQITNHPSIHHHPFYYLPCMDDAMQRLVFVSHRTGRPEIYAELRQSGRLLQLTDVAALGEYSVHPSHDAHYVYFTAGTQACRVACETQKIEVLLDFGDIAMREDGMVGAAMGTTSVSHDDRFWAVPVKVGKVFRLCIIDTQTGEHAIIVERETVGHPEFHPSDNSLLRYAGPYHSRIWVVHRDGTGNRLVYQRKPLGVGSFEWIVHETWRPGSQEIITTNWPRGCIGIDIDTGAVRQVCSFNAWHPSINRQGTLMCADTTYPDTGLQLFDPLDGVGTPTALCLSQSSNVGAHWDTEHCPYDDEDYQQGKWTPYAPQHTHPHPSFSPDGRFVVFTSDMSGHSQVYEATVAGG